MTFHAQAPICFSILALVICGVAGKAGFVAQAAAVNLQSNMNNL
jgi:hypothetical protein